MSVERYLGGLATYFEVSAALFAMRGSVVVPARNRHGSGRVSHHHLGRHSLIWADPDLESELDMWNRRPTTITFDEFREWALSADAMLLGHGLEHVLPRTYQPTKWASQLTVLDGRSAEGIQVVRKLLDECSDDDVAEAEFEIENLDPFLVGWSEGGRLLALAGGRREAARPLCRDIGVLVHPDARLAGRGRAVVGAVADQVLEAGHVPLYRCESSNIASQRLCRSVGFELALELDGFQWPIGAAQS